MKSEQRERGKENVFQITVAAFAPNGPGAGRFQTFACLPQGYRLPRTSLARMKTPFYRPLVCHP